MVDNNKNNNIKITKKLHNSHNSLHKISKPPTPATGIAKKMLKIQPKNKKNLSSKELYENIFSLKTIKNNYAHKNFDANSGHSLKHSRSYLSLEILNKQYDNYFDGIFSEKSFNLTRAYAFNSYKGLSKSENEDEVIVCNQIKKPENCKMLNWPKISYYALFDGHGGSECSTFLKNNFLDFLVEDKNFPIDIKASLFNTFERAEREFLNKNEGLTIDSIEPSGSCALVILIVDNIIYIANVGDSRAILSMEGGSKVKPLTIDHKANNPKEFERLIKHGAKVYYDEGLDTYDLSKLKIVNKLSDFQNYINDPYAIYRAYPSGLAVVRTIGDFNAKKKEIGGLPGAIIGIPEIYVVDFSNNFDFIIMGCDGIYDKLTNLEVADSAWFAIKRMAKDNTNTMHVIAMNACNMIIKNAMHKKSNDNVSCIFIALAGLEKYITNSQTKSKLLNGLNVYSSGIQIDKFNDKIGHNNINNPSNYKFNNGIKNKIPKYKKSFG